MLYYLAIPSAILVPESNGKYLATRVPAADPIIEDIKYLIFLYCSIFRSISIERNPCKISVIKAIILKKAGFQQTTYR